jgi:tRNA A37 N6-isopentenylltransferase MiaA
VTVATGRLARYQRKWLRRLPGVVTLDANRPPEEIAADIVALGRTGQHLSRHD